MTPASLDEVAPDAVMGAAEPLREAAEPARSPISPVSWESSSPATPASLHEAAPAAVVGGVAQEAVRVSAPLQEAASPVTAPSLLRGDSPALGRVAPVGHDAAEGGDPTVGVPEWLPSGLSEEQFRESAPQLAGPWYDIYKLFVQRHPEYLHA